MIMDAIRKVLGGGGNDSVTCMEALERIYEFLDGELDPQKSEAIEEHFEKCSICYPHLKMEENFRSRLTTALARPTVPAGLKDRVLGILDQVDETEEPAE